MSYQNAVEAQIKKYEPNKIIVASELYNQRLRHIPEPTFYKALERMTRDASIVRLAKGIYCIPKATRFGTIKSSEKQIIEYYTGVRGEHGLVVGYNLYGKYGLTTQVSKKTEVYSNRIEADQKTVGNVLIRRAGLQMTSDERSMVETLEILEHYGEIENFDNAAFSLYLEGIARRYNETAALNVQRVLRYKKRTIAFLAMILDSFNVRHGLRKLLSGTSSYKLPKMEEIYEAAQ
jgi:hypothetical protein